MKTGNLDEYFARQLQNLELRPRVDSWHRLLPAAFGESVDEPAVRAPDGRRAAPAPAAAQVAQLGRAGAPPGPLGGAHLSSTVAPVRAAPPAADESSPTASSAPAAWAVVEVNGVRFPVPAGVAPQPEQDPATGEWYLRVGPNVRYGPLRFF